MDVVRKRSKSRKWIRWFLLLVVLGGGIAGTTAGLSNLKPALPEFDRSGIVFGQVDRGLMTREVHGSGTLIPEDINFVTSEVGGRVVEILVQPGVRVEPDTVLFRLEDPQLERARRESERRVQTADDNLERFNLQQASSRLDLKVATATARANYEESRTQAELNEALVRRGGLISQRQWELSRDRAERLFMLLEVQIDRVKNRLETEKLQLRDRKQEIDRAGDLLKEKQEQEAALIVKAGVSGILQQLGSIAGSTLQLGQRIAQGVPVAVITDPTKLMAEIQIAQTQVRDVVEGQTVRIDTRNGIIAGRVRRIDPSVQNQRVKVEVELTGPLTRGARPDLSVEGIVEVSRLEDVYHVRKPVRVRAGSTGEVFRLEADGVTATRTTVEFGISSLHSIQVVAGLNTGDEIIVSDTPLFRSHDRVTLK